MSRSPPTTARRGTRPRARPGRYLFTPTEPGVHVTGARAYNATDVSPVSQDLLVHAGTTAGRLPWLACLCIHDDRRSPNEYDTDPDPVEVGTRIRFDRPGRVTGIFFKRGTYKGPVVIRFWRGDGTLLRELETRGYSEREEVIGFAAVPVQPGFDYVASYYTPQGGYRSTEYYYTGTVVDSPFIAWHDGVSGAGVYHYGVGGGFPTESWHDSNYWVSPLFYE